MFSSVGVGSSPLARGLPEPQCSGTPSSRIIPARAGFTVGHVVEPHGKPDHPRSRGVYRVSVAYRRFRSGSSPLARGLRQIRDLNVRSTRIIPARAGFTLRSAIISRARSDHPRSRGVYVSPGPMMRTPSGSSPLARGLRHSAHPRTVGPRIIPARAGFTSTIPFLWGRITDHPRSRGVYTK